MAYAALRAVLRGQTDSGRLVAFLPNGTAIAAYPLVGPYLQIEGALAAQTTGISQPTLLLNALLTALVLAIPVAILAAIIDTIFGFFTSRGFYRRFKRLSLTTEQWGRGNFSVMASDTSGDELGQLTSRLNQMAELIQTLLHKRQQYAMQEERNRLARDLHDSVKQRIFAISILVNSAKGMLDTDLERTRTCLQERLLSLGGTLLVDSFPGKESRITACRSAVCPHLPAACSHYLTPRRGDFYAGTYVRPSFVVAEDSEN
jgi:signal transduction histidine kinase